MNSMKSEEGSVGIKIRKWQGDRKHESLPNENHESCPKDNFFDSLINDGDLTKTDDAMCVEIQFVADNMAKRSQHSANESNVNRIKLDERNHLDSQSITMISHVVSTLSTPKRHHCTSPIISDATDNVEQAKNENSLCSPASLHPNAPTFASLKDLEQEKPDADNDTTIINPTLDQTSPLNQPSLPLQHNEGSITFSLDATDSKVSAYSNEGKRSASLLPKLGSISSNASTSLRNKVVSKSKKHSSRTNLYIRGLPKSMSEKDLVSLVPDASAIRSVKLVVNNDGEGYGFIDFVSNEAALIAMQHIRIQNSSQYVNFAYESEKDPLNIYVTNIPESWNSDSVENLKQIFAPYGKITSALVMTRRSKNTCTGTGFVRYLTSEEAERAIDGIRKAKIILPGAKRPLELKLADRQRIRDYKCESIGSENGALPLFQQFMRDETQQHLCHTQKSQTYSAQRVENMFNVTSVPDCTMFDRANAAGYVTSGTSFISPGSIDITSSSSDEIPAPPQLTTPAIMPITPAVAATATALGTPLFQFPCIPWIQQDPLSPHGSHTSAYIHPQLATTAAQKATTATATLNLSSLATAYQMANLGVFNYGTLAPAQPFDVVFPFVNGQLSAHPIDATNLYSFGLNQSFWPKACFYG